MFALGHIHFKKYTLYVTLPVISEVKEYQQGADNQSYYEVLLSKKELLQEGSTIPVTQLYNFYVDIMSEPLLRSVMEVDEKLHPIKDFTDMVQYQAYLDRKSSSQPLYKLSHKNVTMLIGMLEVLDK